MEIYPVVNCRECGAEHNTYNCPKCDAVTTPDALTCPRCNQQTDDLLERRDGQLADGKWKLLCKPCVIVVDNLYGGSN